MPAPPAPTSIASLPSIPPASLPQPTFPSGSPPPSPPPSPPTPPDVPPATLPSTSSIAASSAVTPSTSDSTTHFSGGLNPAGIEASGREAPPYEFQLNPCGSDGRPLLPTSAPIVHNPIAPPDAACPPAVQSSSQATEFQTQLRAIQIVGTPRLPIVCPLTPCPDEPAGFAKPYQLVLNQLARHVNQFASSNLKHAPADLARFGLLLCVTCGKVYVSAVRLAQHQAKVHPADTPVHRLHPPAQATATSSAPAPANSSEAPVDYFTPNAAFFASIPLDCPTLHQVHSLSLPLIPNAANGAVEAPLRSFLEAALADLDADPPVTAIHALRKMAGRRHFS